MAAWGHDSRIKEREKKMRVVATQCYRGVRLRGLGERGVSGDSGRRRARHGQLEKKALKGGPHLSVGEEEEDWAGLMLACWLSLGPFGSSLFFVFVFFFLCFNI